MVETAASTEIGSLRCRECGAPHDGQRTECAFCRAPLATLRCGHCFLRNFVDVDFCAGCGEHLGLEPLPLAESHACPDCGGAMVVFEDERAGLWDCEKCHAQFVAHAMLEALIAGRQQWHRAPAPKPSPLALGATIRYRRCPVCHHWMQRRNFGATSGVVVDVCAAHGVWFDTWELQQVLAFVEAGGLADLRRAALGLPEPRSKEEQLRSARAVAEAIERAQRTPAAVVPEPNVWRVSVELLWELIEQCLRRAK